MTIEEEPETKDIELQELIMPMNISEIEHETIIENNLTTAESQLWLDDKHPSQKNIEYAIKTLVDLKNFIVGYALETNKDAAREIKVIESIIDHFESEPYENIVMLNDYIFPILNTKYGFGLLHAKEVAWMAKTKRLRNNARNASAKTGKRGKKAVK